MPGIDYQSGNLGLTINHRAARCVQVAREVLGRELCEDPEENYARLLVGRAFPSTMRFHFG
eukprot:COSAG01_NODE_1876_length_8997_cov_11.629355_6_plen_61_part_00